MSDFPRISYSTHCSNTWEPTEVGGSFLWLHKSWIKPFLCCKQTWIQIHFWLWPRWVKSPMKGKLSAPAEWDLSKRWYRGMGKVDRNLIWEKLAEVELEDTPGLLKVGGCNFCWIHSLFFCLSSCPAVSSTISSPCHSRKRGCWCTSAAYQGASLFLQLWASCHYFPHHPLHAGITSFEPVAVDEVYTFFSFVPPFSPYFTHKSQWWQRFSVTGLARK